LKDQIKKEGMQMQKKKNRGGSPSFLIVLIIKSTFTKREEKREAITSDPRQEN
jgi:hypothetical protein